MLKLAEGEIKLSNAFLSIIGVNCVIALTVYSAT